MMRCRMTPQPREAAVFYGNSGWAGSKICGGFMTIQAIGMIVGPARKHVQRRQRQMIAKWCCHAAPTFGTITFADRPRLLATP
jgi:hypothetical protein